MKQTNVTRGPGRPPIPEHKRKNQPVATNLTAREFERVSKAADKSGLTLAAFVRERVLG